MCGAVPSEIRTICDRVHKENERDDTEGVDTDGDNCEADGGHSKHHIDSWHSVRVEPSVDFREART